MEEIKALKKHKFIILGDGHFNTLGIVRSLGEVGIRPDVVLVGHNQMIVRSSKYIQNFHHTESIEDGLEYIISEYSQEKARPFLLTGSDKIIAVIDRNYNRLINKFFFFNAGKEGRINWLLSKKEQNILAESCGFNVPIYEEVRIGEEPTIVPYPLITKAIDSTIENWKDQVFICHNKSELANAYSRLKGERILLQQYIEKSNETGFDALTVNQGEDTYLPLQLSYYDTTETSFGNSIYFFEPKDEELCGKVKDLMKKTQFSGIFSIDLLIGKDGKIYFLEVNFRNSAWSYPSTCAGVNLPYLWAQSVLNKKLDTENVLIKKLPYSAIVDSEVMSHALREGLGNAIRVLKKIWKCDCCIIWNQKDQGPFWSIVRSYIKRRCRFGSKSKHSRLFWLEIVL